MEEHPPLFTPEELNGLPETPSPTEENVVPLMRAQDPLVPVFNPAEMVSHPAPQNTELSLADAAAKYKEMVGVWPNDELQKEDILKAISSPDAARDEHFRLMEITRREDAEELQNLYRRN
jgi:hypothetical protein